MKSRTVLIGLDGATFSVLDSLMGEGVMPFLEGMIASGTRAELFSVVPPLTPPAWTSLMTGRSPGNHGVFDFFSFEFQDRNPYLRVTDANDVRCETIWSIASRQGLKTTVLNFPLTSPPRPISGYVVPGWVPWRHLRLACYPDGLYDRIKGLPGFNARDLAMDMSLEGKALEGKYEEEDYEEWILLHLRRERQWFEILRHLMKEDPCDLTAVLFDGVDKLQHFCWRFLDPECFPANPSAWELKIRNLCLDYFREIDRFLAEISELAGPEANTVIVSDHGFGASVEVFHLNAWLHEHGYLFWAKPDADGQNHEQLGVESMARRFYDVDWTRTVAYCPAPSSNAIYFSNTIREHQDRLSGENYARVRGEMVEALRRFTDPVTGEPVVKQVWTREEAFSGRYMGKAPDVTVAFRDCGMASILPSDTILKPRHEPSGTHRPEGIFIASGPAIRKGASLPGFSILNVAPTLLYSLGLPIPEDFEGTIPTDLFDVSYLQQRPIAVDEPTRVPEPLSGGADQGADDEDEQEMVRRLKALGYME